MTHSDIILASASPRRRELLALLCERFRVSHSTFDETEVPAGLSPAKHVVFSARMKARDVARTNPQSLVIGADTVVVAQNEILGKPANEEDAARMLRMLSGVTHQVFTGLAVIVSGAERCGYECTEVTFSKLDEHTIRRYVDSDDLLDKAGAYAIQGKAAALISGINGCYFNVVGLPLHRLRVILAELGIEVP